MDELTAPELLAISEAAARVVTPVAGPLVVIGRDAFATAATEALSPTALRIFNDLVPVGTPAPLVDAAAQREELTTALFAQARAVVTVLPKSLAELDEIAHLAAENAAPDVVLIAAGREKNLTRSMNDVLARSFTMVSASRGWRKSRALVATSPRAAGVTYPRITRVPELGFDIVAHGGAFAGDKLDIGTRALLDVLPEALAPTRERDAPVVLDLGCGTGVLAVTAARLLPHAHVLATDRSWAAAASARATAAAAGVVITVTQEDAAESIADGSVDVVLLNPPFHDGHAVVEDMADHLFRAAARVLRRGGTLLTVFNSHLRHRASLERVVGPTTQLSRTPKFTVTRSVRH